MITDKTFYLLQVQEAEATPYQNVYFGSKKLLDKTIRATKKDGFLMVDSTSSGGMIEGNVRKLEVSTMRVFKFMKRIRVKK